MKIVIIHILLFLVQGTCSNSIITGSAKILENPYKLDFINNDYIKLVDFLNEQRIIGMIKLMEKENLKLFAKEKEEKIYRDHLASRVSSSVLRDFHTFRY